MAFYLIDFEGKAHTWYVNETKPSIPQLSHHLPMRELYADGHELQLITTRFKNLPIRRFEQPTKWRGEMAQFIYDNL